MDIVELLENEAECVFLIKTEIINSNFSIIEDSVIDFMRSNDRDVVLDFRHVTKIDSLSLAGIIRIKDKTTEKGLKLSIVHPGESVLRIFQLAGLESYLLG